MFPIEGHVIKYNVLEDDCGCLYQGQERPQDGDHTAAMETTQYTMLLGIHVRQRTTLPDKQPGESQQIRHYSL